MTDYASAQWMPNTNFFEGRNGNKPLWIILHGTAGGTSAQEIATYFQGTEGTGNPVSSHYIIGEDGTIVQTVLEANSAYGNGVITGTPTPNLPFRTVGDGVHRDDWWNESINPNYQTISIEHVKSDSQNATALTPAQQAASFALIKDICQRNNIPTRFADANGGVTGHFSIDVAERSDCPNTYPWNDLWTYLTGETPMTIDLTNPVVATYFSATQDPQIWQCKNGFLLGHGLLAFYQKFGGDALCGLTYLGLPLSPEAPVLNSTGTTVGAVYQRFERAVACYNPNKNVDNPPGASDVFLLHLDKGPGQDPRIAQLEAQIATLTQPAQLLQQLNGLIAQASTANAQIGTVLTQAAKLSQVQ